MKEEEILKEFIVGEKYVLQKIDKLVILPGMFYMVDGSFSLIGFDGLYTKTMQNIDSLEFVAEKQQNYMFSTVEGKDLYIYPWMCTEIKIDSNKKIVALPTQIEKKIPVYYKGYGKCEVIKIDANVPYKYAKCSLRVVLPESGNVADMTSKLRVCVDSPYLKLTPWEKGDLTPIEKVVAGRVYQGFNQSKFVLALSTGIGKTPDSEQKFLGVCLNEDFSEFSEYMVPMFFDKFNFNLNESFSLETYVKLIKE